MGFKQPDDAPNCPTCVSEDTLLLLQLPGNAPQKAIFASRDVVGDRHRDGINWEGSSDFVLLQTLPLGTKAQVVALPNEERSTGQRVGGEQVVLEFVRV